MYAWEEDQTNYSMLDYNCLFQELRKLIDTAIDYQLYLSSGGEIYDIEFQAARTPKTMQRNDEILRSLDLSKMTHETLALLKVTMYPEQLDKMVKLYPNLMPLREVKPLEKPLYLCKDPLNLYRFIQDMNIYE